MVEVGLLATSSKKDASRASTNLATRLSVSFIIGDSPYSWHQILRLR
jgi:hypothetical protein